MATLPRGMQHVDRQELYTSLHARVHFLKQFLEFGEDDLVALTEGHPHIKSAIPKVVDSVYKKLLRFDITARVFSNRDSRIEEDPETWVIENSSAIRNRKIFLRWFLTRLTSDPSEAGYWEYLDKVGFMHVGQGRRNPLHVEYTFLGATLGYIQNAVMESILSEPCLRMEQKLAIVKAFDKLIWIQNDLLARYHTHDGEEYRQYSAEHDIESNSTASTAEGDAALSIHSAGTGYISWVRNKENVAGPSSNSSRSSICPFSGVGLEDQRAELVNRKKDG